MKKIMLPCVAVMALLLSACDNSDKALPLQNNADDIASLISNIEDLKVQYQTSVKARPLGGGDENDDDEEGSFSPTKAANLALADAVGAMVAAPTGPFGILWGGFLTTLAIEPYVREEEPKKESSAITNPPSSVTNSSLFDFDKIGDGHNILMYEAYVQDYTVDISSGQLNSEIRNLLISTDIPGLSGDKLDIYENDLEGPLYDLVVLLNDFMATESRDMMDLLQMIDASSNAKSIVAATVDSISFDILYDDGHFSQYLNDVEELVKGYGLPSNEEDEILSFLAVCNSSMYFWKANLATK